MRTTPTSSCARSPRFVPFAFFVGAALASLPSTSFAAGTAEARVESKTAWCAPEVTTLSDGVCHIDGGKKSDRRTLVIFLHGAIAKDTTWQWTQERALLRQAKYVGFEAIFPRSPLTEKGYVWPGTLASQEKVEQELADGWMAAKRKLEERDGRPFDEVFVMGFSSGAYFVSSLAMRGRLDVDGYAAFAGGTPSWSRNEPTKRAPVFVGVCAEDETTAAHSRAFGVGLGSAGIAHRVDEQRVGHAFSDVHVAHAVSFLRNANRPRVAMR
jgi:predicted esterase